MKAFVTGGNGFLGKALIKRLLSMNYDVCASARDLDTLRPFEDQIQMIKLDLGLEDEINEESLLFIDQETTIFHTAAILGAAQASKSKYLKINVDATIKLYQIGLKLNAKKFVFISSMGAAGPIGSLKQPITEEMEGMPSAYYSQSKLLAEQGLREIADHELPIVVIRPPNIYGPGMNLKSGAALVFKGCKKRIFAIIGRGKNYVNFAYIDNVVEGIMITLEANLSNYEVFFVSDKEPYIVNELITKIKAQANSNTLILKFPYFLMFPLSWLVEKLSKLIRRDIGFNTELTKGLATNAYIFSIEKIKNLGFNPPVKLETAIDNTLTYLNY